MGRVPRPSPDAQHAASSGILYERIRAGGEVTGRRDDLASAVRYSGGSHTVREQLQCVQDALRGHREPVPGWNEHFADEIERVLRATIEAEPAARSLPDDGTMSE